MNHAWQGKNMFLSVFGDSFANLANLSGSIRCITSGVGHCDVLAAQATAVLFKPLTKDLFYTSFRTPGRAALVWASFGLDGRQARAGAEATRFCYRIQRYVSARG